jgi:hypothetical protein
VLDGTQPAMLESLHRYALKLGLIHDASYSWWAEIGKQYMIGLPILAVSLTVAGYFGVKLVWRLCDLMQRRK